MGEYANRKHDNARIKIGTCEDLYYLRWEDRYCVTPQRGDIDPANETGLRFRLPFPDEDDVLPGNYEDYNRGLRLYRTVKDEMGREWTKDYQVSVAADPGSIQFSHPSGLLFSIPCHHGAKLPDIPGISFHWNGKSHSIELCQVKTMPDGSVAPIIRCRHCGSKWRSTWEEIIPYIHDDELLRRLLVHANLEIAA